MRSLVLAALASLALAAPAAATPTLHIGAQGGIALGNEGTLI